MANKILYEDKETFQVSPLDEVNKATAANFNSIKDTVNLNADELNARPSAVQDSNNTFDVDEGAADAYVITLTPAITAYVKGQLFSFEAVNANLTTTPTIDVDGQGAQTIINRDGTALSAGDIPANSLSIIQYDGTNFQLMTTLAGGGGAAWVPNLTTGDVSAIQNTVTSDISAQTGTTTFDMMNVDITSAGRSSTGEVNFLNFLKDSTQVFMVNLDGQTTIGTKVILSSPALDTGLNILSKTTAGATTFSVNGNGVVEFNVAVRAIGSNGAGILNETASDTNPTVNPRRGKIATGHGGLSEEVATIIESVNKLNVTATEIAFVDQLNKTMAVSPLDEEYLRIGNDDHDGHIAYSLAQTIAGNDTIAQSFDVVNSSNSPNGTCFTVISTYAVVEDATGDTGWGGQVMGQFVKNSSGTLSQIGSTVVIGNNEDLTGTPTAVYSIVGGDIRLTLNSSSDGCVMTCHHQVLTAANS